jgi:hypothetical protein
MRKFDLHRAQPQVASSWADRRGRSVSVLRRARLSLGKSRGSCPCIFTERYAPTRPAPGGEFMGSSQKRRRHLAEAREAREEAAKERANPVSLATLPCRPPLLVGRCFFQRDDEEVDVWWRWEGTRVGSRPGGKAGKGHRRFVKGLG